jgi:hypothetical protein
MDNAKNSLTESRTDRFAVGEDLVKLGIDLVESAERLQKFLSKEFYSRATDYAPEEASASVKECEVILSKIKALLVLPKTQTFGDFKKVFEEILGGIRLGRIKLDKDMYRNATRLYNDMKETSEWFAKIVDKVTDYYPDDFYGEDSDDAIAALILALKRLKVIK